MTAPRKRFTKIKVEGRIHLGHSHDLVQAPRAEPDDPFASRGAGWIREFETVAAARGDARGEVLGSRWSDRPVGDLHIEGDGLVTSFGIFGAPGSGKTVLLMHLLEQVLAHEPGRPSKRYGALILDPKAALRDDVMQIVERTG